ncbi:MAG: YdcF family protein, partial [Oscillospiraceae bacterium]|nr:YdcF family protein [Oscillospiraceae bacterium]
MKHIKSKKIKILVVLICGLLAVAALTPCVINAFVVFSADRYIISQEEAAMLDADCILVLGARVNSDGTLSHMLEDRMSCGVSLYKSGAGRKVLASGDHGQTEYDEVNSMKQYAVDNGVPADDVFLDHAGFSTYES